MGIFSSLRTVPLTETDRVLSLPRRAPNAVDRTGWADGMFRLPGATMKTRAVQADALWEISVSGGFFGPIAVGWGKTLICFLAARALGVSRAVLLLPAHLIGNYKRESAKYRAGGFDPGPALVTLVPYSMLSDPRCSALLEELAPEAIIADEAHNLRNPSAARTRRFLRYMGAHDSCAFVCMSGTMFGTSIADGAHLAELALGRGSPLPSPASSHLSLWSHVLDEGMIPTGVETEYFHEIVTKSLLPDMADRGGSMRSAARRAVHIRMVETAGVVSTLESSCDIPLRIEEEIVPLPPECANAIEHVLGTWELPNGEYVDTSTHALLSARNMSAGFYYVWDWDAVGGRDEEWLAKRATWARVLRDELASFSRQDYDSPALVSRALDAEILLDPSILARSYLHWARDGWNAVSSRPLPPVRVHWLSDFLVKDVTKRYGTTPCIVWYSSAAMEDALRATGWEVHGSGDASFEAPARPIAASIDVHGTGRNLQAWSRGVVLEPPASGLVWEQMLGRLHRPGQAAPEVVYSVYVSGEVSRATLVAARRKAHFLQDVQGQEQRLLGDPLRSAIRSLTCRGEGGTGSE